MTIENFTEFKDKFFTQLDKKTGWGKIEVKKLFELIEDLVIKK
jgi:hypothetical protein